MKVKILERHRIEGVNTDRKFTANRPDKIIKKIRRKKRCKLKDVAKPADRNVNLPPPQKKRKQKRN
jgi:hypothetical protein